MVLTLSPQQSSLPLTFQPLSNINSVQPLPSFPLLQPMDSMSYSNQSASIFPATDFVVKPARNGQPEVRLFNILEKGKPVVLIFYPNETFPYCKQQIADMRKKLLGTNAELIGVSSMATFLRTNEPTSASPQEQTITLLSDTTGELQRNYRVGGSSWWGLVWSPNRETVVIDPVTRLAHKAYSSPGSEQAGLVHVEKAREILDRLAQTAREWPKFAHFSG
jgi:peroxiredoxin